MTNSWARLPAIQQCSPILALEASSEGLWSGGLGGVAWNSAQSAWEPRISGLPLISVAALAYDSGCLLAGGVGGVARSFDGGLHWESGTIPGGGEAITALAMSSSFLADGTALAGTMEHGILRSVDSGANWSSASFGLRSGEIATMAWGPRETALAGTSDGIYRSQIGGRAWRHCVGSEGRAIASIVCLDNGVALAAIETGGLLRSNDDGISWTPCERLPNGVDSSALSVTPRGTILLGTTSHGLFRSSDGSTWTTVVGRSVLSLTVSESRAYVGTDNGIKVSDDDGETWKEIAAPPLHDLRHLLVMDDGLLAFGTNSTPLLYCAESGWSELASTPRPISCGAIGWSGSILVSTPDGLFRSSDRGASWQLLLEGDAGCVTQISVRSDGAGWIGGNARSPLLMTRDHGESWEQLDTPFGVLPLAALQTIPGSFTGYTLLAATYDPRQRMVSVWRSVNDGMSWERGSITHSDWPVVSMVPEPLATSVGDSVLVRHYDGDWEQSRLGGAVRRIVGHANTLVALTTSGIWKTTIGTGNWERDDDELSIDRVMDIALQEETLYVLLAGGEVWSRQLKPQSA